MKLSILNKLEQIKERFDELTHLLSDSSVISQNDLFRNYSKEYSELEPTVFIFNKYLKFLEEQENAKEMLDDPEMRELAEVELIEIDENLVKIKSELQIQLLPVDLKDKKGIYLEIRAGTGGDEAAIFVGDIFRMYSKYIEKMGWKLEVLSASESEKGGFKEIITKIDGSDVYAKMKFESGAHRVQRVPETESQGRVHTSAITVAVIPEPDESVQIEINPNDLRIDTYRSSGAGGQHVNTTDSAVRITHLPTGTVVECQEERSQHKNKAKAMSWLSAKLQAKQEEEAHREISETRKNLVGSGDRSERIRTYNYPQGRLTDHRINLTLYALSDILNGDLDLVIEPLQSEYQADLLANLGEK